MLPALGRRGGRDPRLRSGLPGARQPLPPQGRLLAGAINGGTAQLYQQAIFRPFPGLGRPTTPIRGLYLASSSAHPGGGLHGGPGGNAARTALRYERARSLLRR